MQSLWNVETFVEEVGAVREALGLDRIHLFGNSWGGMLAMEYALTKPTGLESLVLSSSPASIPLSGSTRRDGSARSSQRTYSTHSTSTKRRERPTTPRTKRPPWSSTGATSAARIPGPTGCCAASRSSRRTRTSTCTCRARTSSRSPVRSPTGTSPAASARSTCRPSSTSGRHDECTPLIAETVQRRHPGSRVGLVRGRARTCSSREEPERYLDVLDAFLTRVEAGR